MTDIEARKKELSALSSTYGRSNPSTLVYTSTTRYTPDRAHATCEVVVVQVSENLIEYRNNQHDREDLATPRGA
jgi:hypothetical protein